jgi:DNA modification methylase
MPNQTINYITSQIDPKSIILPNFSFDEKEMEQLIQSIKDVGLQNTPVCILEWKNTGEIEVEKIKVISGKKRVFAAIKAGLETILIKLVPKDLNLSPTEIQTISLHENLKRHNLQWYDQVTLEKELHELRQEQNSSRRGDKNYWGIRQTADELGMAIGPLSENIRLAEAVLVDPSLKKIKDKTTAMQVVFNTLKRASAEITASLPTSIKEVNQVYHGSAEKILQIFPENSFDVCITDPPWIDFNGPEYLRKDVFTLDVFKALFPLMKQSSFLYMFLSIQDWNIYFQQLKDIGWSVQKYPLIWIKEGMISRGTRAWEYNRDYENILLAVKGQPTLTVDICSSIFSTPTVHPSRMIHPNEKPVGIITKLLNQCSYEGSLVIDPFAGSGVVGEACKNSGRKYILVEREDKYYGNIKERLSI